MLHMVVRARAMPSLGLLLSKNADPRLGTPPAIDLDSNPQIKGLLLEKIQEIESGVKTPFLSSFFFSFRCLFLFAIHL